MSQTWREAIVRRCKEMDEGEDDGAEKILMCRNELEAEQKRLVTLFQKGYLSEGDLDMKMEGIRSELFRLPVPEVKDTEKITREALLAGEALVHMSDYWHEAAPEEQRDMVWAMLDKEGLLYDLQRHVIVGIKPRKSFLSVLALGLEATAMWEQRGDTLLALWQWELASVRTILPSFHGV